MSDGTVAGTVLRAFQFSGWNPTDASRIPSAQIDDDDPVVRACQDAWEKAQQGSQLVGEAVRYLNVDLVRALTGRLPGWAADPAAPSRLNARLVTAVIGRHTFLKGA